VEGQSHKHCSREKRDLPLLSCWQICIEAPLNIRTFIERPEMKQVKNPVFSMVVLLQITVGGGGGGVKLVKLRLIMEWS
jgi:hypothetical protein